MKKEDDLNVNVTVNLEPEIYALRNAYEAMKDLASEEKVRVIEYLMSRFYLEGHVHIGVDNDSNN